MKSIAIFAVQMILAVAIVAMGCALIGGPDAMVQRFAAIGLGDAGRIGAGAVQILAGLCLLLPRGQVVGAALLAFLTLGVAGITIGHVAAGGNVHLASSNRAPQVFSAVAGACERLPANSLRLAAQRDWAI